MWWLMCLLQLFLFSRPSLADDYKSNELSDSNSSRNFFTTPNDVHGFYSEQGTKEPSHAAASEQDVLDDLCRFHGDFPSSGLPAVINPASIEISHEIFDTSFGLVPQILYNGEWT